MVKLIGPCLHQTARGWLGGDMYGHRQYYKGGWIEPKGVNLCPYPIGLLGFQNLYSLHINPKRKNPYNISAFGLRPYPAFISMYYSHLGWYYQRRRTWYGTIWSAGHPPISKNPKKPKQLICQGYFRQAISIWQAMDLNLKGVYEKWHYPIHASGYNRWISWYLKNIPSA